MSAERLVSLLRATVNVLDLITPRFSLPPFDMQPFVLAAINNLHLCSVNSHEFKNQWKIQPYAQSAAASKMGHNDTLSLQKAYLAILAGLYHVYGSPYHVYGSPYHVYSSPYSLYCIYSSPWQFILKSHDNSRVNLLVSR
jgi:hypothetical protein